MDILLAMERNRVGSMLQHDTGSAEHYVSLLNDQLGYMDLVGALPIPDTKDHHDCWKLIFVGECHENVITFDVSTRKGMVSIHGPTLRDDLRSEAVRQGFKLLRAKYERLCQEHCEALNEMTHAFGAVDAAPPRV